MQKDQGRQGCLNADTVVAGYALRLVPVSPTQPPPIETPGFRKVSTKQVECWALNVFERPDGLGKRKQADVHTVYLPSSACGTAFRQEKRSARSQGQVKRSLGRASRKRFLKILF
ncbi:MAG TPA: hypothetical protein VG347_16450 [Verrucomicrobiae bacterium]|nr:hypothetical protein [Verrucomicrobiae bacterium]